MKLKVNLAGSKPSQKPEEQEGWLSYLNRNIVTPAARGIATRVAGSLPKQDYGLEAIREFRPDIAQAVEAQGPMGLASQEAPNPIIGTAAQLAPGFVQAGGLTGVKRAGELAKTTVGGLIGGEAGAALGQSLGLGEKGQQALGIAGSVLGGAAGRHVGFKRPSAVLSEKAFDFAKTERPQRINELKKEQNRLYKEVNKGYGSVSLPAKKLNEAINRIESDISLGVDDIDKSKLDKTLSQLRDIIKYDKVNVNDAIKFVQNRNKAVYDQSNSKTVKDYNKQLIADLNDIIEEAGTKNPILGRAYQQAKDVTTELHELQDQQNRFQKMSFKDYQKDLTKKNTDEYIADIVKFGTGQILPTTLSAIGYYLGGPKGAAAVRGTLIGGKLIKQEISNIRTLLRENPGLSAELEKLGKAAAQADKPLFESILARINDRISKSEKKEVPKISGKIRFR